MTGLWNMFIRNGFVLEGEWCFGWGVSIKNVICSRNLLFVYVKKMSLI